MNEFVEILILFVSEYRYISPEDFLKFAYSNIQEYERILDEKSYLSLLSASLADKDSVTELIIGLRAFVHGKFASDIDEIDNDGYVEKVVDSDRGDYTAKCLRKLYVRRNKAEIDLAQAKSDKDIVRLIKQCIDLPSWCGDSLDAMDDILGEGNFPIVLEVKNIDVLEKELPKEAAFFRKLFEKNAPKYCTVKYV